MTQNIVSEQTDLHIDAPTNDQRIYSGMTSQDDGGDDGNWLDWAFTAGGLSIVVLSVGCFLIFTPSNYGGTLFLSSILGGVIGWASGILATPYNNKDRTKLGDVSKVMSSLATGYLVAKADRLFEIAVPSKGSDFPIGLVLHGSIFTIMLIAVFIFTYVSRSYEPKGNPLSTVFKKIYE